MLGTPADGIVGEKGVKGLEMNGRRRAKKQLKNKSANNIRTGALLTPRRYALLLLFALAAIAKPVWDGWRAYSVLKLTDKHVIELADRQGPAMYRNEALTMSVRMAALTGDLKWVERYHQFGGRIRLTVEEHWAIPEMHEAMEEVILTGFTHDKLAAFEQRALELVRHGKPQEAVAVLDGQEYLDQKHAYGRGVQAFSTSVRKFMDDQRQRHRKNTIKALAALCIVLPAAVLAWFIVLVAGSRIKGSLQAKSKEGAFGREWQETFNAITDGVCIISGDKGEILQCNKAMTRFLQMPYGEIIGRSCCELLHGSPEPVKRCPLARMFKTHRSETLDFQVGDKWFNVKVDPVIDDKGELVAAVHILSDITEHRKATRALRGKREQVQTCVRQCPGCYCVDRSQDWYCHQL